MTDIQKALDACIDLNAVLEAAEFESGAYPFELLQKIKAALESKAVPDGWQPIETAPKDGTMVLLYGEPYNSAGEKIYVGQWDKDSFCFWFDCCSYGPECKATHWMPLPPPPEVEK